MNKRYSRKDIAFYGKDAEVEMDLFVSLYEDLLETMKGWNVKHERHYSTYTNSWVLHIWVTKESWNNILSNGLLKKHEKNTRGNSLWKYSPEI